MKPLLISVLIALGVAGCASAPDLPAKYALNADRPEGLAIASLTLAGKPMENISAFEYRLREVSPRGSTFAITKNHYGSPLQHARSLQAIDESRPFSRTIVVKGINTPEPLDIKDGGQVQGRLAVVRLPPGEYELYSWRVREPNRYGESEYAPPNNFSYRFRIRAGEATYIGRLNLYVGERNAVRIAVEDRHQEDLKVLELKHPTLVTGQIASAVGSL
jgi:hypothetical protein